jgi:signal transduction histidine kinase
MDSVTALLLLAIAVQAALILAQATQRRRDRARLTELNAFAEVAHASRLALVGQLTASIAHEINHPLGAILSNADAAEMLLERDSPDLDEVRAILADIKRDDIRASEVVHHVRELLGKNRVARHALDANALARDVVKLAAPEAARRGLAIELVLQEHLPVVWADRVEIQQVLLNVILNAMDATAGIDQSRRTITISSASRAADVIEMAIRDLGRGIEPAILSRLFESFVSTKPQGMGLGLSIAKSIVIAHGGRIHAENNPGGGATVRFTLRTTTASIAA